jgi:NosR/NirI family nitrous oxide reductase transcriptional regulator
MNPLAQYTRWIHTRWPAGLVEKLPEVGEDGRTAVPGLRVVGDLTGIPLLKFSADTGAKAVQAILREPGFKPGALPDGHDLIIVGGGVSGVSAALEAKAAGLRYLLLEASEPFNTIVNFPKGKPIYTYPSDMTPAGKLSFRADVKEGLLEELEAQRKAGGVEARSGKADRVERRGDALVVHVAGGEPLTAQRVIVAIGRSGNYRRLGVPGEDLDKVYNRLHDPAELAGQEVLVVGGGDSALEAAVALDAAGAKVTLSYRKPELARPKPDNVEALAASKVAVRLGTQVQEILPDAVRLRGPSGEERLPNDVVFTLIGREAPLDFFRRSGVAISGEWRAATWAAFLLFFAFCVWLYNWKSSGVINQYFQDHGLFPFNMPALMQGLSAAAADPRTLVGTLTITLTEPGFYYTLAYSVCVVLFGIDRIRRRKTPYVKVQTYTLMAVQLVPLFILPYIVLPYLGHNGAFELGSCRVAADNLFPEVGYGHGREYWRAFGFILAWPLFIWNIFTEQPMTWWLIIGGVQTFVIIPLLVRYFGKGAYCGWICSCGALAETLGDRHRHKMPHGPRFNRLNMVGQGVLAAAFILFFARVLSWSMPNSSFGYAVADFYRGLLSGWSVLGVQLNYYHVVDVFLAGIVGVGFYFWFSGRVWCRFACPLAALMHIYARFSKFRIFSEKKKCISCNVCTTNCHQGIDVMGFANKGLPMEDPECVRCSACVQMCPTGVLSFGRYAGDGLIKLDTLKASATKLKEG